MHHTHRYPGTDSRPFDGHVSPANQPPNQPDTPTDETEPMNRSDIAGCAVCVGAIVSIDPIAAFGIALIIAIASIAYQ